MADKEISDLSGVATLTNGDLIHIVQGGNSRKAPLGQLAGYVDGRIARDLVTSPNLSRIRVEVREEELTLSGASAVSTIVAPQQAILFGVGVRTTAPIAGAPSFDVGIAGEPTKFGAALGLSLGTNHVGLIVPQPIAVDTPIIISATSGAFSSGKVRIALWIAIFHAPSS